MKSAGAKTAKTLHWKWYLGLLLVFLGGRAFQGISVAGDILYTIAVFGLFHVCYWLPPQTAISYRQLILWLAGILGITILLPRLVIAALLSGQHLILLLTMGIIISLGAILIVYWLVKLRDNKKDNSTAAT